MQPYFRLFGCFIVSACIGIAAQAQDLEQALNRVETAYAVEQLEQADTIRLESEYRLPFDSHDYSVDFHDLTHQRFHIILDFKNQQGSHEYVTEIARTSYHGRNLIQDGKSTFISYGPDTYVDSGEGDFYTLFGGTMRASDVLLAYWMTRDDAEVRFEQEAMWLGHQHDIVEAEYPNSPPLRIFVRQADGAITKMERRFPDDLSVIYTFRQHDNRSGGLIAREHSLFVGGESVYFGFNRSLTLDDPDDQSAFELDQDLAPEATRTDQSEMTVQAVGDDMSVHQVCQGEGCTTFMAIDDHILGYGMANGFADRLEAYRTQTENAQPLRFVIAADHHDEDIGGAGEASAAGATLLVTDQTAQKLRAADQDHDIEIISETRQIGDLTLFAVSTDHTISTLVVYHEAQGLLMQTGHYYSSFVDQPSYARQTAVSLYDALPARIKSEAVAILSGQDLKAETWADFVSAIEAHEPIHCHRNRPICAMGGL